MGWRVGGGLALLLELSAFFLSVTNKTSPYRVDVSVNCQFNSRACLNLKIYSIALCTKYSTYAFHVVVGLAPKYVTSLVFVFNPHLLMTACSFLLKITANI